MKYRWHELTAKEQAELLAWRKSRGQPWHSPQHRSGTTNSYHLTAACYQHAPYIGQSLHRIRAFCEQLLPTITATSATVRGWCVLPNHYHLLIETPNLLLTLSTVGKLHGRTSFDWNAQDHTCGRKVWYRCVDRSMRNKRHHWATLNYIHNNPVHHGYVRRWQDWPFGSAVEFLEQTGIKEARELWQQYPVLDYGKGWDDPEL